MNYCKQGVFFTYLIYIIYPVTLRHTLSLSLIERHEYRLNTTTCTSHDTYSSSRSYSRPTYISSAISHHLPESITIKFLDKLIPIIAIKFFLYIQCRKCTSLNSHINVTIKLTLEHNFHQLFNLTNTFIRVILQA